MTKRAKILPLFLFAGMLGALLVSYQVVSAAGNSTLGQTINPGTLATDIRSDSTTSVPSPSVAMSASTVSFNCGASTGTFGTASQRVYVDNPDGADAGWNLTIAATDGTSALWHNVASTTKFDFNDAAGSGCTDGDTDTFKGQLTINPSVGAITADYSGGSNANIVLGTLASFTNGSPITLVTAAAGSADIWRGYITGIALSQTIPAETPADAYSISLTLTVTAS